MATKTHRKHTHKSAHKSLRRKVLSAAQSWAVEVVSHALASFLVLLAERLLRLP